MRHNECVSNFRNILIGLGLGHVFNTYPAREPCENSENATNENDSIPQTPKPRSTLRTVDPPTGHDSHPESSAQPASSTSTAPQLCQNPTLPFLKENGVEIGGEAEEHVSEGDDGDEVLARSICDHLVKNSAGHLTNAIAHQADRISLEWTMHRHRIVFKIPSDYVDDIFCRLIGHSMAVQMYFGDRRRIRTTTEGPVLTIDGHLRFSQDELKPLVALFGFFLATDMLVSQSYLPSESVHREGKPVGMSISTKEGSDADLGIYISRCIAMQIKDGNRRRSHHRKCYQHLIQRRIGSCQHLLETTSPAGLFHSKPPTLCTGDHDHLYCSHVERAFAQPRPLSAIAFCLRVPY